MWMVTTDDRGFVKYWQSNFNNVHTFQAHSDPVKCSRWGVERQYYCRGVSYESINTASCMRCGHDVFARFTLTIKLRLLKRVDFAKRELC